MGGGDENENIAELTPKEHYLAHQLLVKMFPSHRGLVVAALYLTATGGRKAYGWLKRRQSKMMSGSNHPFNRCEEARSKNQEYMRSEMNPNRRNPRRGNRHHFAGKTGCFSHSEDGKRVMSEQKKGDKNPYYGAWGWRHSTCTEESKKVWARADEVLRIHQQHPSMGYARVSRLMGFTNPYAASAVLKKIKDGWNPLNDKEWMDWKQHEK